MGDYDTHFRWPSPSLPPTLKKTKTHKNSSHVNDRRMSSTNNTNDDIPSEVTAESTGGSGSTSHASQVMPEGHLSPKQYKTFSRQNVISKATISEKKNISPSSSSASSSSSSSSSDSDSTSLSFSSSEEDQNEEIELDEFGDVVPPHLRKNATQNKKKRKGRNKGKKQVYKVQMEAKKTLGASANVHRSSTVVFPQNDDGWTTDF